MLPRAPTRISATRADANSVRRSLLGGAGTLLAGGAALPLLMKSAAAAEPSSTSWFVPTSFTCQGIQAAIDSANAQGGGCVFLPPGLYTQNYIVKVYNNIRVIGSGRGNTVIQPNLNVTCEPGYAASICFIAAQRSSIESLTIDLRTNQAQYLNGISLLPDSSNPSLICDCCVVQDCQVLGFDFHQYLIWNYRAQNTRILYNYLDGGVAGYVPTSGQEGIEVFGGYDVLILGNKIQNVGHCGIYPSPSLGVANAENVNVDVCLNQIENCGIGIHAQSCYDSTNGVQWLENVNIHHNQISGCYSRGITLYGAQAGCLYRNVRITENQITNTPVGLINDFEVTIPSENQNGIVWSGNQVDGGNGATGGVVNLTYLQNAAVTRNTITNSTGATAFFLAKCNNVNFSGNVCENINKSALMLQYCDGCSFIGNSFLNYNIAGGYNAIPLAAVTNSVFTQNSFQPAIESYCTQGAADSHELTITQNYLMYAPVYATPFVVPGVNANQGTVVMPSGNVSVTVYNSKVQAGMRIQVSQIAGNVITPFMVQPVEGQFTITVPVSGDGSQIFFWEVIQ